jgi:hypothetical protein
VAAFALPADPFADPGAVEGGLAAQAPAGLAVVIVGKLGCSICHLSYIGAPRSFDSRKKIANSLQISIA